MTKVNRHVDPGSFIQSLSSSKEAKSIKVDISLRPQLLPSAGSATP